jgi:hypothetical protein
VKSVVRIKEFKKDKNEPEIHEELEREKRT